MPRPKRFRWVLRQPGVTYFKPQGVPLRFLEEVSLTVDELEALRLADFQGMDQTKAAEKMKISQSTFQRTLTSARKKISQGLVEGKAIKIKGGKVKVIRG
jgi:predicted DNA-binding protein (UPF0251 family)